VCKNGAIGEFLGELGGYGGDWGREKEKNFQNFLSFFFLSPGFRFRVQLAFLTRNGTEKSRLRNPILHLTPVIKCQFHQRYTFSFYACRSRKRKKYY